MARVGGFVDQIVRESNDFFPLLELMPDLSEQEVGAFVALGEIGWQRFRAGDVAAAEQAFLRQIAIFTPNPEPHLSLALVAADRGDAKAALERLRAAVVRGFTDLARVERAEAWIEMRTAIGFLRLQDAVPALLEVERKWPDWSTFRASRPPASVASAMAERNGRIRRIDAMEPALGPRLARMWHLAIDRVTAAKLETYVERAAEAPDLDQALEQLTAFYTGPLMRWQRLPPEAARRLDAVALALDRSSSATGRPGARVLRALVRYAERDTKGRLGPDVAQAIREALGVVLTEHPDSPFLPVAAIGLVRSEWDAGRKDLAAAGYRSFREAHAAEPALLERVREELGELALWAGGLPDFRSTALDGTPVASAALRGKVVVVDFWATWCQPCIEQFPTLRKIAERLGDDVVVLGVNLDRQDELTPAALREWIAREEVPGRQIHAGTSWDSELVRAFGVKEIPFSLVAGPDGAVVALNEHGTRLEQAARAALQRP